MSGNDGAITFSGILGVWNINVTTGITKPVLGTAAHPQMDLNSVNLSTAPGTLTIKFRESGFSAPPPTGLVAAFGGATNGSVVASVFVDPANDNPFDAPAIMTSGVLDSNPFSDVFGGLTPGTITGDYSIGILWQIAHASAGMTSGDIQVNPVPEPATMMLFGSGLTRLPLLTYMEDYCEQVSCDSTNS